MAMFDVMNNLQATCKGTKPPHEEEGEGRGCSEPENEEGSSDDGFTTGEEGEKGFCRKYEDHTNVGSPRSDEARGQVTGVEVGARTIWTICDHDHHQDHDHCRHHRYDRSS